MNATYTAQPSVEHPELARLYRNVRQSSEALVAPLSDADATAQSMPDASPAKWHLAHTTWFFESMVLAPHLSGYRIFDAHFNFLFNSYYETIGARHPRPSRGLLTRPTLEAVIVYRRHVDAGIERLLQQHCSAGVAQLVELGCHHEQQHQELLLTDILHLFAQNPLKPAYKLPEPLLVGPQSSAAPVYLPFDGGLVEIGHGGSGFAFDSEGPRHSVFIEPYRLANRPVTNREWIEFMADGGYRDPLLWLSEGWAALRDQRWTMPLYWEQRDGTYWTMTLRGAQPLDLDAPVTHVSHFEADAYATWSHRRLPTEMEWENAARAAPLTGNFADSGCLRPRPAGGTAEGAHQLFGDVWEWTRSAFLPYPRFRPVAGAVGEYNAKFMSGQFVLRGGSCVTPPGHIRASYRNFFPQSTRWQFSGVRLAEDAESPPGINRRPLPRADSFRSDVLSGLAQRQKRLPSRWLYDDHGSRLFEEITRLEEYYPTRTETGILRAFAGEIAGFCGDEPTVLEYGAGAALKTELLIEALRRPQFYVPIDIADDFLQHTVARFRRRFPSLTTSPITSDFTSNFAIPEWIPAARRVAFFPGSTIGNLDGDEVAAFLRRIRSHVGAEGRALIGVDLCKALAVLIPAYDDAAGVTARFSLNLLTRINRELAGNFVLDQFQHDVRWNELEAAVEMHLLSIVDQTVRVSGHMFELSAGESIHTESSRKYNVADFTKLVGQHGWHVDRVWTDDEQLFGIFGMSAIALPRLEVDLDVFQRP
jgi:dimethylhistidine N-methyltransferase